MVTNMAITNLVKITTIVLMNKDFLLKATSEVALIQIMMDGQILLTNSLKNLHSGMIQMAMDLVINQTERMLICALK